MNTGTIVLNFETPEINLTGTGEFDISETFNNIFTQNPAFNDSIVEKINDIFSNINPEKIATDWQKKIQDILNIKPQVVDIKNDISKNIEKILKSVNISDLMSNGLTKALQSNDGILKSFIQSQKKNSNIDNTDGQQLKNDTIFKDTPEVIITDFSDVAYNKLNTIFDKIGKKIEKPNNETKSTSKNWFDKLLEDGIGGILKGLGISTIPALLANLAGPALLAGGLLWAALDGIKGWFLAEEWGVSNIAGAIGGALAGTGNGVENALYNAGKGALIGAGIGTMIGGPVGFIVGTLVGAAIGGILGYFGGEVVAKQVENIKTALFYVPKFIGELLLKGLTKNFDKITTSFFNAADNIFLNLGMKFPKMFEGIAMKIISKDGLKMITKVGLTKFLKALPFVGMILSFYDAGTRISSGDWVGGLIAIGAGIASFIPGVGTGISILLDLWNMKRDTEVTQTDKIARTNWSEQFYMFLKSMPIVSSLLYTVEAFGHASTGDWKNFGIKMGLAGIGIFGPILDLVGMGTNPIEVENKMKKGVNFWDALSQALSECWLGKFGIWIADGIMGIGSFITNAWDTAVQSLKDGFTWLFDIVKEIPNSLKNQISKIMPDYITNFFKDDKNEPQRSAVNQGYRMPTKPFAHQDAVIEPNHIILQPDKSDKFQAISNGGVLAKKDVLLDKKMTDVEKAVIMVEKSFTKSINNLIQTFDDKIEKLVAINQQQLKFMPNLVPLPQERQTVSNSAPQVDNRDPAYEYRKDIHNYIRRF